MGFDLFARAVLHQLAVIAPDVHPTRHQLLRAFARGLLIVETADFFAHHLRRQS